MHALVFTIEGTVFGSSRRAFPVSIIVKIILRKMRIFALVASLQTLGLHCHYQTSWIPMRAIIIHGVVLFNQSHQCDLI